MRDACRCRRFRCAAVPLTRTDPAAAEAGTEETASWTSDDVEESATTADASGDGAATTGEHAVLPVPSRGALADRGDDPGVSQLATSAPIHIPQPRMSLLAFPTVDADPVNSAFVGGAARAAGVPLSMQASRGTNTATMAHSLFIRSHRGRSDSDEVRRRVRDGGRHAERRLWQQQWSTLGSSRRAALPWQDTLTPQQIAASMHEMSERTRRSAVDDIQSVFGEFPQHRRSSHIV